MARDGLTFGDVVEATGLDERTVRGLVRGANNPHARTLHKFAQGLGISIDELFQPAGSRARQAFDRATNPLVQEVVAANAELFSAWSPADFDELYSQFGHGGPLTRSRRRRRSRSDQRQAVAAAQGLRDSRKRRIGTPGRLREAALSAGRRCGSVRRNQWRGRRLPAAKSKRWPAF